MYMKYINLKYAGFVLFPSNQKHSDIAQKFPDDEVESAGQVILECETNPIHCFGESPSLRTAPKKEDADRIYRQLQL